MRGVVEYRPPNHLADILFTHKVRSALVGIEPERAKLGATVI